MTKVFVKTENGRIISVESKGHAEFARRRSDIVCSAISILMINTVNSISNFTNDKIEVESDQKQGRIVISLPKEYSEATELLLKSLLLGLSGIREEYPKNISIYTEEVLK